MQGSFLLSVCIKNSFISSTEENETSVLGMLQTLLPNLPVFFWQQNKEIFSKCQKVPDIYDLKFNNKYWQVKEAGNVTIFLYAAYFDTRNRISFGKLFDNLFFFINYLQMNTKKNRKNPLMAPVIRILTMIKAEQFEENWRHSRSFNIKIESLGGVVGWVVWTEFTDTGHVVNYRVICRECLYSITGGQAIL